ncbi:VirB3 family type IV secretion system protein [Pseudomonas sp. MF5691]|uniref:VirB3 family type IV secretion system protein n=1 Tax=Pseudomonas sp. MF5691 TaxID=2797526 RepID=UPI0018E908C7|nr:VirB3 family type IV secretion system protein [Pseudomonas sp. MF5691]MBJ2293270.1 VirB3 family type IV secretion system protein [Pseudomonas sp. MF5691]
MSANESLKKLIFESYNAMSRPAMQWGIPIMPMVALLMGGLVCGVAGTVLLSWVWGLLFLAPFAGALAALRFICAVDAQYPRRLWWSWRRIRMNWRYGKRLLLTPFNPNWSQFYGKRFAQRRFHPAPSHEVHAPRGQSAAAGVSRPREHGDIAR